MKTQIQNKKPEINPNSTQDLLKIGNERLAQIDAEKKKQVEAEKNTSFW